MPMLVTVVTVGAGLALSLYVANGVYWWHQGEKTEKPKYEVETVLVTKKKRFGLGTRNEVEVRKYAPYIVAEADIPGDSVVKAGSNGFMTLAGYIFGDNQKRTPSGDAAEAEKLAMTAPVVMQGMPAGAAAEAEKIAMTAPVVMQEGSASAKGAEKIAMTAPVQMQAEGTSANGPSGTYRMSFVMPSKYTLDTLPTPNNANVTLREVAGHRVIALTYYGIVPRSNTLDKLSERLRTLAQENSLEIDGEVMVFQYHPPFAPWLVRKNEVVYNLK